MPHQRPRRRRIVGVMIDGDVIRGVELRRGPRGLRVLSAAEVEAGRHTRTAEGRIDQPALTEALRELWSLGKFRTRHVALGISGSDATIRPMTVPPAAAPDIAGFARYELGEYLPYALEDAIIDYQVVNGDDTTGDGVDDTVTELVTVGVRTRLVEDLGRAVSAAKLTLASVDAAPTALAAAIEASSTTDGEALVSVDGSRTTVVIRQGGRPRLVRVLAEGGGDRSSQLADELESLIATVDQHRHGTQTPDAEGGQARRFTEAAEAVTAAINYDTREFTGSGVVRVVLTGSYGEDPLLHGLMADAAGVEVIASPTPRWWSSEDQFAHYVEPAGIAFAALGDPAERFDLQASSVVAQRAEYRQRLVGLAAGIVIGAATIPMINDAWFGASTAVTAADSAERRVSSLRLDTAELAGAGETHRRVLEQEATLGQALDGDLWWSHILRDIANATGPDTFLTSMSLVRPAQEAQDGDLVASFSGVAPDQAAVGAWLEAMGALPILDNVWLVQSTAGVHGDDATPVVTFLAEGRLTAEALTTRAADPTAELLGDLDLAAASES